MLKTLREKDGKYTHLQLLRLTADGAAQVYRALYIKNDGYTENRVVTIKNNRVLAWQS